MKKYDVVTFGSGTRDTYLLFAGHQADESQNCKNNLCFKFGSKVEAKQLMSFTGGGGSNVAAALSHLGFKTAWAGMVGDDFPGENIISELTRFNVDVSLVKKTALMPTNQSVVLLSSDGTDRTILVYRGASSEFGVDDLNFELLQSQWIYIAPLSGKNLEIEKEILSFAHKNNIKIFMNPSLKQLAEYKNQGKLPEQIDVMSMNLEEAQEIYGQLEVKDLLIKARQDTNGIVIITMGKSGSVCFDGNKFYKIGIVDAPVLDTTGAGDSFNAGFLAAMLNQKSIEYGLQLGTANSAKNVSNYGPKIQLLKKDEDFVLAPVEIENAN